MSMKKERIDLGVVQYHFDNNRNLERVTVETSYNVIKSHLNEIQLNPISSAEEIAAATATALASYMMHASSNLEFRDPVKTPIKTEVLTCVKNGDVITSCSVMAYIEVDDIAV